jgi:hypothetical protein
MHFPLFVSSSVRALGRYVRPSKKCFQMPYKYIYEAVWLKVLGRSGPYAPLDNKQDRGDGACNTHGGSEKCEKDFNLKTSMEWVICICFKILFFRMIYPKVYLFRLYYTTSPHKNTSKIKFLKIKVAGRDGGSYRCLTNAPLQSECVTLSVTDRQFPWEQPCFSLSWKVYLYSSDPKYDLQELPECYSWDVFHNTRPFTTSPQLCPALSPFVAVTQTPRVIQALPNTIIRHRNSKSGH